MGRGVKGSLSRTPVILARLINRQVKCPQTVYPSCAALRNAEESGKVLGYFA